MSRGFLDGAFSLVVSSDHGGGGPSGEFLDGPVRYVMITGVGDSRRPAGVRRNPAGDPGLPGIPSDDVKNHVQEHHSSAKLTPAQKKLEKAKKAQEKKAKKAEKAALKQHMKDQSPATRKRMKEDAKEAKHNREHTREFFLKRWFTKKPAK